MLVIDGCVIQGQWASERGLALTGSQGQHRHEHAAAGPEAECPGMVGLGSGLSGQQSGALVPKAPHAWIRT